MRPRISEQHVKGILFLHQKLGEVEGKKQKAQPVSNKLPRLERILCLSRHKNVMAENFKDLIKT